MALAKKPQKMKKHQNGTVKASVFLTPELNRRLKIAADQESERTGERVSLSTYASRILETSVPKV